MITIRRIQRNEGLLYKRMRLASLSDSPDAFSTTYEEANRRSLDSWTEQANSTAEGIDRVTALAFYNDEPVGIGALYRDAQEQGTGEVIQFWVDPDQRGGPIAGKLIIWLIKWAETYDYHLLIAWVHAENNRAISFYQEFGFNFTDTRQLFRNGTDIVSCLMVKPLSGESDPAQGSKKY